MPSSTSSFILFNDPISDTSLPAKFTYPYYYQPHSLCIKAANELQGYLQNQTEFNHDFGIEQASEQAAGKMFGVLIVKTQSGQLGYLTAFSGKLAGKSEVKPFVPPVYDMMKQDELVIEKQNEINAINNKIEQLETNPDIMAFSHSLEAIKKQAEDDIAILRHQIIESRKQRKIKRNQVEARYDIKRIEEIHSELNKQSVAQKNELKQRIQFWDERVTYAQEKYDQLINPITLLKEQRRSKSKQLQTQLFECYSFLNSAGKTKNLHQLFENTVYKTPPAGAGDCAAPKLLHYAFLHGMKPIAMAEFWWGKSPKSEIRIHKQFYGACTGKCKPILTHMLSDIELDDDPLLINKGGERALNILYQDDVMVIINKPAELLSVPGKHISDSVYTRMRTLFPDATGPLIVHRLDMSTSGLMVIALTKQANERLQKQFIGRTVSKRYIALLQGELEQDNGEITLPLRGDFDDRPRQLVCFEHGKPALTKFNVIAREEGKTRIYFYPQTGRTHQLRMHSAHYLGLNMAIIGDDLYGTADKRLYLHAERLTLQHPITHEEMTFTVDAEF